MAKTDRAAPVIVLVGAGHAHLHIASKAADYAALGARLVLIDPGRFWYSGMATGLIAGRYSPDDDQVDPDALIRAGDGEFIADAVARVDVAGKTVFLESGEQLRYDWLSLNVGSEVDT